MTTACAALGQLAIGSAVSTPALDLPAHTVFNVLAPRDTADLGAEDHLRQAMQAILGLAGEHDVRSLAMPALGAGRIRARNHVAAAIIVKALLEDATRLAPQLQKVTICLPSMALLFGFSKAQQLNDPDDRRPKRMDVAVRDLIETLPPARFAEQHRRYAGGAAPELTLSNDEIQ